MTEGDEKSLMITQMQALLQEAKARGDSLASALASAVVRADDEEIRANSLDKENERLRNALTQNERATLERARDAMCPLFCGERIPVDSSDMHWDPQGNPDDVRIECTATPIREMIDVLDNG